MQSNSETDKNKIDMKVKVNMEVEKLIALFIGTQGKWNGSQMEYFPELPECFTNNLDFQCSCGCNADFLRLTANDLSGVECWFSDEEDDTFFYGLSSIEKTHPMLYASIVTEILNKMK